MTQGKKHIADSIIEFETLLAMKAETNDMHIIFLLKKNVRSDIIKTILEYPSIMTLEIFKEWKVVIVLVGQECKSTKGKQNYRTGSEITYKERGVLMNIRKFKDSYNKDRKPRCFNYNI